MPCYNPLTAWRTPLQTITFDRNKGISTSKMQLPCGSCIGCRLERSRQWAMRCMHEAKSYEDNCFITLTYADDQIPEGNTLIKSHFQNFMKRLRFEYNKKKIRFYACGEYGDSSSRPHYHACLFNHDFTDKTLWKEKNDTKLYVSETLNKLWPLGFATIGALTFESAAYTARYVLKKQNGANAASHYEFIDTGTGEVFNRTPEFTLMSRNPGLGTKYFEEFGADVYPSDTVIVGGFPSKPPRFYDKKAEKTHPHLIKEVKEKRIKRARTKKADQTPERLKVREKCAQARIRKAKREI